MSQEIKKATHYQCNKEVYTNWEKNTEGKFTFYEDQEGKTIHQCAKKQYQGKRQRTKEEVDKMINESLLIALKAVDNYNSLHDDNISKQIAIAYIFKGCVELYK